MRTDDKALVDQLRTLARMPSTEVVQEILEGVRPEDLAEALQRLETDEQLDHLALRRRGHPFLKQQLWFSGEKMNFN